MLHLFCYFERADTLPLGNRLCTARRDKNTIGPVSSHGVTFLGLISCLFSFACGGSTLRTEAVSLPGARLVTNGAGDGATAMLGGLVALGTNELAVAKLSPHASKKGITW